MDLIFREAQQKDLPCLVQMLADDPLGKQREDTSIPLNPAYQNIFNQITRDKNNLLIIVEQKSQPIGMMQLTYIPYLTHTGSWRCLIEGVRINKHFRGQNLGRTMIQWAIAKAREKGCHIVQLTSDKTRVDALKFYESLGFKATHEGFKLQLN